MSNGYQQNMCTALSCICASAEHRLHSCPTTQNSGATILWGATVGKSNLFMLPMQEISKGSLPYLYGGKPPGCKNCKSNDLVGKFCQYGMTGHGQCDKGQIYYLVQQFLDREFYEILQFTPCDLWPLLKGRTLYFSGDSQTQVDCQHAFLASVPHNACFAQESLLRNAIMHEMGYVPAQARSCQVA